MYMSKFKKFMQKKKGKKTVNNTFNIMITTILFFIAQLYLVFFVSVLQT